MGEGRIEGAVSPRGVNVVGGATRAAAAGMPITTLAAILGHSNLRSVMKYVHTQQSDIDAAMDRLDPMRTGRKSDKAEREGKEYGRN
jgi:hypothetical protein